MKGYAIKVHFDDDDNGRSYHKYIALRGGLWEISLVDSLSDAAIRVTADDICRVALVAKLSINGSWGIVRVEQRCEDQWIPVDDTQNYRVVDDSRHAFARLDARIERRVPGKKQWVEISDE